MLYHERSRRSTERHEPETACRRGRCRKHRATSPVSVRRLGGRDDMAVLYVRADFCRGEPCVRLGLRKGKTGRRQECGRNGFRMSDTCSSVSSAGNDGVEILRSVFQVLSAFSTVFFNC